MNHAHTSSDVESTAPVPHQQSSASADDQLMTEWLIDRTAWHFYYGGYRYDRLADAVAYAKIVRARRRPQPTPAGISQPEAIALADSSDERLMLELSITTDRGRFIYEGFKYDLLSDAVSYARHRWLGPMRP